MINFICQKGGERVKEKRLRICEDGLFIQGKKVEGVTDYVLQAHTDQFSGQVECRLDLTVTLDQADFEAVITPSVNSSERVKKWFG